MISPALTLRLPVRGLNTEQVIKMSFPQPVKGTKKNHWHVLIAWTCICKWYNARQEDWITSWQSASRQPGRQSRRTNREKKKKEERGNKYIWHSDSDIMPTSCVHAHACVCVCWEGDWVKVRGRWRVYVSLRIRVKRSHTSRGMPSSPLPSIISPIFPSHLPTSNMLHISPPTPPSLQPAQSAQPRLLYHIFLGLVSSQSSAAIVCTSRKRIWMSVSAYVTHFYLNLNSEHIPVVSYMECLVVFFFAQQQSRSLSKRVYSLLQSGITFLCTEPLQQTRESLMMTGGCALSVSIGLLICCANITPQTLEETAHITAIEHIEHKVFSLIFN